MTKTYNMKDLATDVSEKFDLSAKEGMEVTRYVFDRIKEELTSGKQVRMHHFGTLEARKRAAGFARNPATGDRIAIPSRLVVKLTVSNVLKAQVSGKSPKV